MNGNDLIELEEVKSICERFGLELRSCSMDMLMIVKAEPGKDGPIIVKAESLGNLHYFLLGYEYCNDS